MYVGMEKEVIPFHGFIALTARGIWQIMSLGGPAATYKSLSQTSLHNHFFKSLAVSSEQMTQFGPTSHIRKYAVRLL